MIVFPHAKINLGLHVTEKRADGFHNIETVFYPIGWKDVLEILPSDNFSYQSSGLAVDSDTENNLIVKAYRLLQADYNLPDVSIYLHKIIPMGAGLGGGSADAAFALTILNRIFNLNISTEKLQQYASQLGSDCAFFIESKPVLAKGKGDEFSPINISLSGYYLAVIHPGIHVNTAVAYSRVIPRGTTTSLLEILSLPVTEWKATLVNDFEPSVFEHFPEIGKIKEQLYDLGANYACMSGSGSSVFGLFKQEPDLSIFSTFSTWIEKL